MQALKGRHKPPVCRPFRAGRCFLLSPRALPWAIMLLALSGRPMNRKLRVGIVGAPRGGGYLSGFRAVTETEVAAMCDLNEQTLKDSADHAGVSLRYTN